MNIGRVALVTLFVVVFICVCARYVDYVVRKDFIVYSYGMCDPALSSCFATDCDPSDEACDAAPYTKLSLPAYSAPHCLLEFTCEDFVCDPAAGCVETFCSEESLEEGEVCVNSEF